MNLGMPEMIFIFLLALVIFGPKKLPELGRQLGKALAEFKKASNEFKNQLEVEMMNIELEERAKKPESGAHAPTRREVSDTDKRPRDPVVAAPGTGTVPTPLSPMRRARSRPPAEPALPPAETPVNGNARVAPDA